MKKEIIKIKEQDLKEAVVRGLGRAAWQSQQNSRSLKEQVHQNPKRQKPKHKPDFSKLADEF